MKLKKIHRILKFKQSDWMKAYIDFNADKRKELANESDQNLFKLMKMLHMVKLWKVWERE